MFHYNIVAGRVRAEEVWDPSKLAFGMNEAQTQAPSTTTTASNPASVE